MSKNTIVLHGSSGTKLSITLAQMADIELGRVEIRHFPDGERYIRVMDDVKGKVVLLVQSLHPKPDEMLMEFFFLYETLEDLGATVFPILPYFAYARQDKRFNPGESVSIISIVKLFENLGISDLYTVDMHLHRVGDSSKLSKSLKIHNLSASPLLAEYLLKNHKLVDPVVIGPDEEAHQWAAQAARVLKADSDILVKKRYGDDKVEIKPGRIDVTGRDILLIDDIISTGGTILEAINQLRNQKPRKVYVACTHAILAKDALTKIYRQGVSEVFSTDTILAPTTKVSVAPLFMDLIQQIKV